MVEIQAVVVSHQGTTSVARRQWVITPGNQGVGVIDMDELGDLAAGLDNLAAGTHVVVGDANFFPSRPASPRMVLLVVTIDGTAHRLSARGFSPSGAGLMNETKCFVVHGLSETDLADFLKKADGDNLVVGDLDGLQVADRAIIFVDLHDIANQGGSTAAVDHADAVDGGD